MKISTRDGGWNSDKALTNKFVEVVRNHLEIPLERRGTEDVVLWSQGLLFYDLEKRKNQFHIFVGGGLRTGNEFQSPLAKMWGIQTDFRGCNCGNMHQPSGQGLFVIEPGSEYPVAELIGNNLFILVDLNERKHLNDERSFQILGKILEEVVILLGGNFPSLEKIASGRFILPEATNSVQHQQLLQTARKDLSAGIALASKLQQKVLDLKNRVPQADQILEGIARIPEVKEVRVNKKKIIITTQVMYGLHPKTKKIHEYGRFQIEFTFGESRNVSFKNLDRRPFKDDNGTYGHPHVDRGGTGFWCEGEGKAIYPLIESFEYEAAILFALKAIESVNEIDGGNYLEVLSAFPTVSEKKPYPQKNGIIGADTKAAFARIFDVSGEPAQELEAQFTAKKEEAQRIQARIARLLLEQVIYKTLQSTGRAENPEGTVAQLVQERMAAVEKIRGVNSVKIMKNSLIIKLHDTDISFNFVTGEILLRNNEMFRLSELWTTLPELFGGLEWDTALGLILTDLEEKEQKKK